MSLTNLSQCNGAVSSENPDKSADQEKQEFIAELTKTVQKENFWRLFRKNLSSFDKCFSFLRGPSPGSRNYFQQLHEILSRSSLVESYQSTNTASPAIISRVNFNPPTQKFNLNNFLMFLLCTCIPVGSCNPPPVKIMVCLPCPAPVWPSEVSGSQNRCEVFPFGVPRRLESCEPQASKKGKQLPAPAKRHCSKNCLHVRDLKPITPCKADKGCPCVAHCFESHPKCPSPH